MLGSEASPVTSTRDTPASSLAARGRGGFRIGQTITAIAVGLALSACTRTLELPVPETLSSPAGPMIDIMPVTDERSTSKLGKLDTLTIESGTELAHYLETEFINGLARMGLAVRQVDPGAEPIGLKRIELSLRSAELSSESTALQPVVATVFFRLELTDETGRMSFSKDFRGGTSRKLGFHKQGGGEDATLLVEAIEQAVEVAVADRSFRAAVFPSEGEAVGKRAQGASETHTTSPDQARSDDGARTQIEERLSTLDQLLEEGLIDQDDYTAKRREILDDL
jgi:hypothetical protein